nr:MAG TPA: hypothetical protein [Caudoviricetes sp.]
MQSEQSVENSLSIEKIFIYYLLLSYHWLRF